LATSLLRTTTLSLATGNRPLTPAATFATWAAGALITRPLTLTTFTIARRTSFRPSAGAAWSTGATTIGAKLVFSQLAVLVLVECLQRRDSTVDFVGRDNHIIVRIECRNERRPWATRPTWPARLIATGAATALTFRRRGRLSHDRRHCGHQQKTG
jgi:hypothetical protein